MGHPLCEGSNILVIKDHNVTDSDTPERDNAAFCLDDNGNIVDRVENGLPHEKPKTYGVEYDLEHVVLKAGTLKIDVNARGRGTFELDGKPIRGAQNIVVEFEVGKNPTLYIESVILDEPAAPIGPTASATSVDPVQSIKDEELQRELDRVSPRFPERGDLREPVHTKPLFFGGGMMHVDGAPAITGTAVVSTPLPFVCRPWENWGT